MVETRLWRRNRVWFDMVRVLTVCATLSGCSGSGSILSQEFAVRRLSADLRVQFTKAAEASNRAVLADTDEASTAAAHEAEAATQAALKAAEDLQPLIRNLGHNDEIGLLEAFNRKFAEYRTLDAEILGLAVENTNLKAQQLSFGSAREAADRFGAALDDVARASHSAEVDALAARAELAVRQIQVIHARHIAESDDAAMSKMESEMAAAEEAAKNALKVLDGKAPAAKPKLDEAAAALDRFKAVSDQIVALSRRNSNVRSLALAMGRKRTVTAECDDALKALQDALARHEFRATR